MEKQNYSWPEGKNLEHPGKDSYFSSPQGTNGLKSETLCPNDLQPDEREKNYRLVLILKKLHSLKEYPSIIITAEQNEDVIPLNEV
jgi:hypothetical protein